MSLFEVTAYDKQVYEEELKDFLPDKILDVHTHVYLKEFYPPQPSDYGRCVTWPSLVAADNSFEDLQETYRLMFPGKDVKALMFAKAPGYSVKGNEYLADITERSGWPALYFSHPTETADQVEEGIRKGGFLGVKSYLGLSKPYIPEKEIRIYDFFPKEQLARLNEMGAICMLHIPRDGRLKDPVNINQIMEIKADFPKLRLIIAHIGRAYTPNDLGNAFDTLEKAPDLMYDFCANCYDHAIAEVLRHAGPKHVMFGTDMPILRLRTHRIIENGTYINLVPPKMYGDLSGDPHMREVSPEEAEHITFFAYEELLAFKRAAQAVGLTRQDVEDVMYNNAMGLIDGARKSIYG